jgi:hypothetical protein
MTHRLPAYVTDDIGRTDYTMTGQADADCASALMALAAILNRSDLTTAERRDFRAAEKWIQRSARAISRHIMYNETPIR